MVTLPPRIPPSSPPRSRQQAASSRRCRPGWPICIVARNASASLPMTSGSRRIHFQRARALPDERGASGRSTAGRVEEPGLSVQSRRPLIMAWWCSPITCRISKVPPSASGSRRGAQRAQGRARHFPSARAYGVQGTTSRSALQIAEAIENVGGDLNAATSIEHNRLFRRVLKEDVVLAADILSDILQNSLFEDDELTREKQ